MRKEILSITLVLFLFSSSILLGRDDYRLVSSEVIFDRHTADQVNPRVTVPMYLRLQALEETNVSLWESIPQNFTDHVATVDSNVLALFISSNSLGFNLSKDSVGNLWVAANYSLNAGEYISTLAWVSSRTTTENLSSLEFTMFPASYPDDVKVFLEAGRKMPANNETIQQIAANHLNENMTQTVENIVAFVNTQGYDREKSRLLLSGTLNTTDILDFFKDALQVYETNSSMCLERSWYAAAILRAAGVPTRTVTDVRLKTWIQVWLPNIGWVDAETLCAPGAPHVGMFPKSLLFHVPWMIENSSDARFPFGWVPHAMMRVANLTFDDVATFKVNEYKTVLTQPVDALEFEKDPNGFSFPIVVEPQVVYAAVTESGSELKFFLTKAGENASKAIVLGEPNSLGIGDLAVSFTPTRQVDFLVLQDFVVQTVWRFDLRLLAPIVGIPVAIVAVWLYWNRRRQSR